MTDPLHNTFVWRLSTQKNDDRHVVFDGHWYMGSSWKTLQIPHDAVVEIRKVTVSSLWSMEFVDHPLSLPADMRRKDVRVKSKHFDTKRSRKKSEFFYARYTHDTVPYTDKVVYLAPLDEDLEVEP